MVKYNYSKHIQWLPGITRCWGHHFISRYNLPLFVISDVGICHGDTLFFFYISNNVYKQLIIKKILFIETVQN